MCPSGEKQKDWGPTGPRHHYVLAHIALLQACEMNTALFFEIMASEARGEFLHVIWNFVCEHCDHQGKPRFSIEDVKFHCLRVWNRPTIVVQMPEPTHITEAHLVAIILDWQFGEGQPAKDTPFFYFTLEKGEGSDGSPRTVLCRWTEGTHCNYGDGPPVDIFSFIEAIEPMLGPSDALLH